MLQESTTKMMTLGKGTSNNIENVGLTIDGLKQESINLFTKVFTRIESLKTNVNSSNNDLEIFVQISYSSFSKILKIILNDLFITYTIPSHSSCKIAEWWLYSKMGSICFWVVKWVLHSICHTFYFVFSSFACLPSIWLLCCPFFPVCDIVHFDCAKRVWKQEYHRCLHVRGSK